MLGVVLAAACSRGGGTSLPAEPAGGFGGPVTVRFAGAPPITAEVARTPAQRERGLMQRSDVPSGTGMVFVFPRPSRVGFWMKGTLVPLSIAYVRDGRVVSTAEMQPCRTRECPVYAPSGSYDLAVETSAAFFPDHHVGAGTSVTVVGSLGVAT